MYLFELHDILFAIKSIKTPTILFNITNYFNFSSTSIRSGANNKLKLPYHLNNILTLLFSPTAISVEHHVYFWSGHDLW